MNNMFQSNSRFAILSEDLGDEKNTYSKNNKKKNDSASNNRKQYTKEVINNKLEDGANNIFSIKISEKAKENKIKRQNDELVQMLSIDNFPELSNKNSIENEEKKCDELSWKYIEPIHIVKNNTTCEEDVPYGWVLLNHDKKTNTFHKIYNKQYVEDKLIQQQEEIEMRPFLVLDALVNLHAKLTEEYINNCGYEEYEQMFISPYYDPYYFDKLDAKEKEKEEELREEEIKN